MDDPHEAQIEVMRKDLGAYCLRNGYRLGTAFVDRGGSACMDHDLSHPRRHRMEPKGGTCQSDSFRM